MKKNPKNKKGETSKRIKQLEIEASLLRDAYFQLKKILLERDRALKEKLELDKIRNKFIEIVSHQLRTPLTSVRWNLGLLLAGDFGELKTAQKEMIRAAFGSAKIVIDRLHDLLVVIDIEEGRVLVFKEEISFETLLESVIENIKKRCKIRSITFEYQSPKKPLPSIFVDSKKICEVFAQLMNNAVIYTKEGGKINVKLSALDKCVRFEVTDTGVGIPKAEQHRVFTRFFRATNASAMLPDASGVGLAITKHYIEQHKGKIGFKSKEGKGSTFWFELPIKK